MTDKATLLRNLKRKTLFILAVLGVNFLQAQYVSIPDSGFVNWLQANGYAGCFNGGQLDTTCMAVLNATYLNTSYSRISSLEGVQYFKSLDSLKCNSDTTLTYIPALPKTLRVLECRNDSLVSLPALPDTLTRLACEFNVLSTLPALPASLQYITCYNNNLSSLPALPAQLKSIFCSGNVLGSLPALPDSLTILSCYSNKITTLPSLPGMLTTLLCADNLLTGLPALPASLTDLNCYSNTITSLPTLPDSLKLLTCSHNKLTTLPSLPNSVLVINCSYNKLTSLPALPDSLFQLFIDNNTSLHCLPTLNTIVDFEFFNTGIACLPNAGNIYLSNPDTTNVCDSTFNPNGCQLSTGIKETTKPVFTIFPNPAKSCITVAIGQNAVGGVLRLTDNTGRIVYTTLLQALTTRIETTGLQTGLYFVMVSDTNGRTSVCKLVIE